MLLSLNRHVNLTLILSFELYCLAIIPLATAVSNPIQKKLIKGSPSKDNANGNITSPGYPRPYSSSEQIYLYHLQNMNQHGTVALSFSVVSLAPLSSLKIYDGDSVAYPSVVLKGKSTTRIQSRAQSLLLVFKTGRSNIEFLGFNATYQFLKAKERLTIFSKVAEASCLAPTLTQRCWSSSKCYSDVDICDGFNDCGGKNSTDEAMCGCQGFESHARLDAMSDLKHKDAKWPKIFYLGKGSIRRCREACRKQPKCMVFTMYNRRHKDVKLREKCYGGSEIPRFKWKKVSYTVTESRTCNPATGSSQTMPILISLLVGLHLVVVPLVIFWSKKRRRSFCKMLGNCRKTILCRRQTRDRAAPVNNRVITYICHAPPQRSRVTRPGRGRVSSNSGRTTRAYRSGSRSPSPRNRMPCDTSLNENTEGENSHPSHPYDLSSLYPTPPAPTPATDWPGMPEWARRYQGRNSSELHPIEQMFPEEFTTLDDEPLTVNLPPEDNLYNYRGPAAIPRSVNIPSVVVTPPDRRRNDHLSHADGDNSDTQPSLLSPTSASQIRRPRSRSAPGDTEGAPPAYEEMEDRTLLSPHRLPSDLPSYDAATRLLPAPSDSPVPPPAYEDL